MEGMKVQLETIPVWDGVKSGSECFLCDLMKEAEDHAVSYYLGSAVMVPEIRVEMNRVGFCPHHFASLASGGKPQALGLLCDTYYEEGKSIYAPHFDKIASSSSLKKAERESNALFEAFSRREEGCLICQRMDERLERYVYTIASLYGEDPSFRKALENSKGFCVHHSAYLVRIAPEALDKEMALSFIKCISSLLQSNLNRVQKDDWWLTQKYKSENKDKPWNGCEDAGQRAVFKLVGIARVLDLKGKKK